MRTVKRIIKIHKIEGYKIFCLFNNGESRIIDFKKVFKQFGVNKKHFAYPLKKSLEEFQQVELVEETFSWSNIEIKIETKSKGVIISSYDVDPIVMYEASEPDESRAVDIGLMIKQARIEQGLTQSELANKMKSTKSYISKIENGKSIELSTLRKVVEGGLGKKLSIQFV